MNRLELNITGMTCGHCQASVARALGSVLGVADAQVDLATGNAVVRGDVEPGQPVAAAAGEGYGAQVVNR